MKARGFALSDLLFVLAIVGALAALTWGIKSYLDDVDARAYKRGKAEVKAQWDATNVKAANDEAERTRAVGNALLSAQLDKNAAEDKAADADQRWKEAVRESNRKGSALASCAPTGTAEPAGPDAGGGAGIRLPGIADRGDAAAGSVPRFSPEFVRQYDAAWTGLSGEPVFEAAAGGDRAAGPGAPWVSAEEIRDNHGENARRCSADRRAYASLIAKIKAAGAAFDNVQGER